MGVQKHSRLIWNETVLCVGSRAKGKVVLGADTIVDLRLTHATGIVGDGFMRPEGVSNEREEDRLLVARVKRGDKDAYRSLVEKYQKRAFALAFNLVRVREDAEDIVQESFVKAYLSIKDFKEESGFYTWLYRIVFNMSVDFKRRINRRGGQTREFNEAGGREHGIQRGNPTGLGTADFGQGNFQGSIEGPQESVFRKEQARRIEEVLGQLSDEHRSVIILREIEGMSYEKIAEVLNVSKGTIMSRLHYARKKLQQGLIEFAPNQDVSIDSETVIGEDGKPLTPRLGSI